MLKETVRRSQVKKNWIIIKAVQYILSKIPQVVFRYIQEIMNALLNILHDI